MENEQITVSTSDMEIVPTVVSNALYDTETHSLSNAEVPDDQVYVVTRPTYMMNPYHSCWGHAYEATLGLLSLLYEYDKEALTKRQYCLFFLKGFWQEEYTPEVIAQLILSDFANIDYAKGTYKGNYRPLHECISDQPILFERNSPHRYIRFTTLIYGGNEQFQRNINNSFERYPHRIQEPVATDQQIRTWMGYAKAHLEKYLGIQPARHRILFIDRKASRQLTEASKAALSALLGPPLYLEEMTLAEQIQAFVDADTVVAVHGTALFHLLWSRPKTKVIEIRGGIAENGKIFRSYAKWLDQDFLQIYSSQEEWKDFDAQIDLTEENLEDIEITSYPLSLA